MSATREAEEARIGRGRFRFYALIWLAYLFYPLYGLISRPMPLIVAGLVVIAATVVIYVFAFQPDAPPEHVLAALGVALLLLGVISAITIDGSFLGVMIYSVTIFARVRSPRVGVAGAALGMVALLLAGRYLRMPAIDIASTELTLGITGLGLRGFFRFIDYMLALRKAQRQIEHLAKAEERARIARDVHDLLGHTLSVIVLKTELAHQLLSTPGGQGEAAREIGEAHDVARTALREVREAVTGYRLATLTAELVHAETALVTAGIRCTVDLAQVALPPEREGALALALREAVTNVVRHSHAANCAIEICADDGKATLRVRDDGRAASSLVPGNGLQGMSERLRLLGGSLRWECDGGMAIEACLPTGG